MFIKLAAAFVLVAVGVASFYGVHYTRSALADDPPLEFDVTVMEGLLTADEKKPPANRVLNGISIAPHGVEPRTAKDDADSLTAKVGADADSQIRRLPELPCNDKNPPTETTGGGDLSFTHPASWLISLEEAVACGSTVVSFTRVFTFANDWEGEVTVSRLRGAVGVNHDAAAARVSGIVVDGRKAVHVEPVRTSTGFALGPEVLAISESWGLTLIEVWESANTPTAKEVAAVVGGGASESGGLGGER